MQKIFRMAKRKRSDDMDLKMTDPLKEELLSGLQGQELASYETSSWEKTTTRRKSSGQYGGFFKSAGERVGGFIGKALGSLTYRKMGWGKTAT